MHTQRHSAKLVILYIKVYLVLEIRSNISCNVGSKPIKCHRKKCSNCYLRHLEKQTRIVPSTYSCLQQEDRKANEQQQVLLQRSWKEKGCINPQNIQIYNESNIFEKKEKVNNSFRMMLNDSCAKWSLAYT